MSLSYERIIKKDCPTASLIKHLNTKNRCFININVKFDAFAHKINWERALIFVEKYRIAGLLLIQESKNWIEILFNKYFDYYRNIEIPFCRREDLAIA